jgi:hypothetical protein
MSTKAALAFSVTAAAALAFVIAAGLIHSASAMRPEKTETNCSDDKFDELLRYLS